MKKILILISSIALIACGPKDKGAAEAESPVAESTSGEVLKLEIESSDQLQYNLAELKATAGAKVSLTLKHTGKLAAAIMGHNIVILAAGEDMTEFIKQANAAGPEKNYLHDGANVIVASNLIGGGESVTVEFTAPAAGTYDFLCTFPGHNALMKGKFIVE
jgi:azurin